MMTDPGNDAPSPSGLPGSRSRGCFRLLGVFIAGAAILLLLQRIPFPQFRTIQELRTSDGKHTARLERLYGYIDVNFRIRVDGDKVYRSPDFAPMDEAAFREWISWDESGRNLVFVVSDRILFAYNLETGREIPREDLAALRVPAATLSELRFEGDFRGVEITTAEER